MQRLGVTADLTFQRGNLGPVDLQLGFKPPTGLGIQIDAGLAAGGGFISFDPAQGRYAGVLDVTIVDIIAVKVIAVLDTKLPDGSDGFLVPDDHHVRVPADPARASASPSTASAGSAASTARW